MLERKPILNRVPVLNRVPLLEVVEKINQDIDYLPTIVVDGMNFVINHIPAGKDRFASNIDQKVIAIYGTLKGIVSLKRKFKDSRIVFLWDGGYERRLKESSEAVKSGLIGKAYKQTRRDNKKIGYEKTNPRMAIAQEQLPDIKRMIELLGIQQMFKGGCEADDLAGTLAKKLNDVGRKVILFSSDKDWYQLLFPNVVLFSNLGSVAKNEKRDFNFLKKTYGIKELYQFVEACSISGDTGDDIEGVRGIGETGAFKIINEYGSINNCINWFLKRFEELRKLYPDLDEEEIKYLQDIKFKSGIKTYKGINHSNPYTGVLKAFVDKKITKKDVPVDILKFMVYSNRLPLSKSLKLIDMDLDIPPINDYMKFDKEEMSYFLEEKDLNYFEKDFDYFEKEVK